MEEWGGPFELHLSCCIFPVARVPWKCRYWQWFHFCGHWRKLSDSVWKCNAEQHPVIYWQTKVYNNILWVYLYESLIFRTLLDIIERVQLYHRHFLQRWCEQVFCLLTDPCESEAEQHVHHITWGPCSTLDQFYFGWYCPPTYTGPLLYVCVWGGYLGEMFVHASAG